MYEAGMTIIECLQSATLVNAKILGVENKLGQISEGYIADIIATPKNPLKDIYTLENITFVMKEGVIYKD